MFWKTCVICGVDFAGFSQSKGCRPSCQTELKRRYQRQWEADHAEHRREYYRQYYAAHRDDKRRKASAYAKAWRQRPAVAQRLRVQKRAYLKRTFLVRKVVREWGVSREEAKAMIESGTFPT